MRRFAVVPMFVAVVIGFAPVWLSAQASPWIIQRRGSQLAIADGIIRVSGGGGWLRTSPAFLDFTLRLRFRAVTEGARGGVLIRANPLHPNDWPETGLRIGLDTTGERSIGNLSAYRGQVVRAPNSTRTVPPLRPTGE